MICVICGKKNCDGAYDKSYDFICENCWYEGKAGKRIAIEAKFNTSQVKSYYTSAQIKRYLDACNNNIKSVRRTKR